MDLIAGQTKIHKYGTLAIAVNHKEVHARVMKTITTKSNYNEFQFRVSLDHLTVRQHNVSYSIFQNFVSQNGDFKRTDGN